ncbi:hypothetical protein UR09_01395 [Candidatus Nitromaritima sp. SCGC AAA799-A02]|nr:hypothetical protein UR09_01395 [Candidatus Nitromaritima sp. SCGC AAA799-A02]
MNIRLTKIIATLGPATAGKKQIRDLVRAGVNVFRLNLSHGGHEALRQWIGWIHQAEKELKTYVGVLLDLQGPKIRVGRFINGFIVLHDGQRVTFTTEKKMGDDSLVPVQFAQFPGAVKKGDRVYLDDGNLCVRVIKKEGRRVEMEVEVGGKLSDFKGLNLPDAVITTSPLTRKDKADLAFGLAEGVDFVALSFAGSARDINQLRRLIRKAGKDAEIIAKVERKQAVQNLEEIVVAADGVMVARGDLGIEIPLAEVPVVQQRILQECSRQAKPAIVATQMLESMITSSRPTRAEVSDVSNAVMFCADAIMLSAETAVGRHPKAAVKVMVETILTTEAYQRKTRHIPPWSFFFKDAPPINLGITYSANRMVELLKAAALVVFTASGGTAKMVAAPRPMVPLLAFSSKEARVRRLTLLRGAVPFLIDESHSFLDDIGGLFQMLKRNRWVRSGDRVVIATGLPHGIPQWTNVIRVEKVP